MKKIFNWALGLSAIALTLTGCGQNNPSTTSAADDTTSAADTSDKTTKIDPTTESSKVETTEEDTSKTSEITETSEETSEGSESSSESSSESDAYAWTADEIKLMQDELYGLVVPHPGYDGISIEKYDDNDLIFSSETDDFIMEDAADYAEALAAFGFDDITDEEDGYYSLEISLELNDGGKRLLYADVAIVDDEGDLAEEGYFYLNVYNIYLYEWPEADIADILEKFGSVANVPEFEADRYYVNTKYMYSGYAGIFCFTDNADAEEDFRLLLDAANYHIYDGYDDYGLRFADAPTEDLLVEWAYDADGGYLIIYLNKMAKTAWPANDVADLVETLVPGSETVIPAFPDKHEFSVYDWLFEIDVEDVNSDAFASYGKILEDADWTKEFSEIIPSDDPDYDDEYGAYYTSPKGDLVIMLTWNSYYGLEIHLELPPEFNTWPTAEIGKIKDAYEFSDVIPGIDVSEGARAFDVLYDEDYGEYTIVAYVKDGFKTEDVLIDYCAKLINVGYTIDPYNGVLNSPNCEFGLVFEYAPGVIQISFVEATYYEDFPLDYINNWLNEFEFGFTLGQALPIDKDGCFVTESQFWFWDILQLITNGNFLDQYIAAFDTAVEGLGYVKANIDDNAVSYTLEGDDYSEYYFAIIYDEEENITILEFWGELY